MSDSVPYDNEEPTVPGVHPTDTKSFDRAASARTLPHPHSNPGRDRAVMSAAPPLFKAGGRQAEALRSEESAGGMASDVGAQAPTSGAVPDAAREATRRAQLAGVAALPTTMRNAIEAVFADDAVPQTMESVIAAAQTLLNAIEDARVFRKDTRPKRTTLDDYGRKQVLIDEAMEDQTSGDFHHRLTVAMGGWAGKAQTFRAMRAALRHRAISVVKQGIAVVESFRGKKDLFGLRHLAKKELMSNLVVLSEAMLLDQKFCLAAVGGKARQPESKKALLKKLPQGWREGFLSFVKDSTQYALPCALLNACGLRPVELEQGVEVKMVDACVRVRINGGKVREFAGQPWRQFDMKSEAFPPWAVDRVQKAGTLTVTAEPDALRSYISRISEKVFPRHDPPRSSDILLSPYVFRHALVSDLRAEDWDTADIAAVIGETSADTVAWYGMRWSSGGRRSHKARAAMIVRESISTARPVRPSSTTGLNQVKDATKRKRGGSSPRM